MMQSDTSVVLVHGAWADGSSWNTVIEPLQQRGFRVLTAAIPMTSLSDDRAALDRTIVKQSNSVTSPEIAFSKEIMNFYESRSARVTILPPRNGE